MLAGSGHANVSLSFCLLTSAETSPAARRQAPACCLLVPTASFSQLHLRSAMEQNSSFTQNFMKSPESHAARNR